MRTALLVCLLVFLIGCKPYPRYRADAETTPVEQQPASQYLTTHEFIELGLILQKYLGKPYSGSSRWEGGIDCSKFTGDVFREFNNTIIPRTAAEQYEQGVEISRRLLKFGDLVFFRTERDRVSHVGVFVGHNEFIHASSSKGVIISNLGEEYWARRYVGAKRILVASE